LSWIRRAVSFRVNPRMYEGRAVSFTLLTMTKYDVWSVVRGYVRFGNGEYEEDLAVARDLHQNPASTISVLR